MFRKIVSNLSFSPALVGQLGFYARRLRKEETTRRVGLVFIALALVVQSLVVFQPPESANAASSNDLVPGGLGLGSDRSIYNFLKPYDKNDDHLKDIMNYMGISREEIKNANYGSFTTGEKNRSWGHTAIHPESSGEKPTAILDENFKKVTTVYSRPLELTNGPNATIYGWIGHSDRVGWFAIMQACGNLVTKIIPPVPTPPKPPKPTPPVVTPPANVLLSKTAVNVSQGKVSASSVAAQASDKITFTLNLQNKGGTAKVTEIKDDLTDVLEYSTLIDNGGGSFDQTKKILSWPDVNLKAGEKQSRTFSVQMLATIPATPTGTSSPDSYNCLMDNVYGNGNGVTIPVVCAPPKVIEQVTTELPHTGPRENMIFAGVVLAVVTYFYLRSKQLGKEVRLIRRDLNAGTI